MSYDVNAVADWFLTRMETDAGDTMSPLKLQKLLYYAQAWHLAFSDEPMFEDAIEPWPHGPTIISIYERFKDVRDDAAITMDQDWTDAEFSDDAEQVLEEVHRKYGEHSAGYLQELTRSEYPYKSMRKGLEVYEGGGIEITKKSMSEYYKKKYKNGR